MIKMKNVRMARFVGIIDNNGRYKLYNITNSNDVAMCVIWDAEKEYEVMSCYSEDRDGMLKAFRKSCLMENNND